MLKSLLMTMVSFMLIIIICFSAFGIKVEPTNFIGHMLQVEGFVGDTADWILNARNSVQKLLDKWIPKVKEAFAPILDVFESLREFFEELDERFSILDNISTWMENALLKVSDFFDSINVIIRYFIDYGIDFSDSRYRNGFTMALSFANNPIYRLDDGSFDLERMWSMIDCFCFGETNESSYMMFEWHSEKEKYFDSLIKDRNTVVFKHSILASDNVTIDNCDFWFVTVNLSIPDSYAPELTGRMRDYYFYLFNEYPVFQSNLTYEYDGYICYLTGFRVKGEAVYNIGYPAALLLGKYRYDIDLCFSYDENEETVRSIWVSGDEYLFHSAVTTNYGYVLDGVYTRDDENGRYDQ